MWSKPPRNKTTALTHNEECCPVAIHNPLTMVASLDGAEYALLDSGSGLTSCPVNYHSPGNKFERFRGFLELIGRFEFELCRRENYFFEGFEFLVRSCECAVACLYPRNSISNVVVSLTVHGNIYTYICKMYIHVRDVAKRYETIVEGRKNLHVRIHVHLHLHLHLHIYMYMYIHIYIYMHIHTYTYTRACTCACARACARGGERGGRRGEWCLVGRCGVCGVLSVLTLNG